MQTWVQAFIAAVWCTAATSGQANAQGQPVLNTSNQSAQCQSIDGWIALTRELGGAKVMTGNMVLDAERRAMAPAFADDIFPLYFGKPYFSLSNGDKSRIDKTLKRCSQNGRHYWYGTAGLSEAFQTRADRYNFAAWHEEIRKHQQGATILAQRQDDNAVKAEAQSQAEIIRKTNKVWTVNRAGDLLLDRPDFQIHAFRSHSHDFSKACQSDRRAFNAAILIKSETTRLSRAYAEDMFDNELIPLVRSICPEAAIVTAQYFFKDVQLDDIARRFETSTVSTRFDFIELPVFRVTTQLDAAGRNPGGQVAWFNNHRPSTDAQPYYETLSGLTHIGRQEFKTDREWAAIQQARADRAERLARAKTDAVTLAGFRLEGDGGVGLITGVEPDAFFMNHRRELVEAVMGYAIAITKLCPSSKIPGGSTIVGYESQHVLVDRITGEETPQGQPTRISFVWPADFYDIAARAVNESGATLSGWLEEADRTVYFRDVQNMVARKGCGDDALINYHNNLRDVAYRVGGDWHDFSTVFRLLADIFSTPQ